MLLLISLFPIIAFFCLAVDSHALTIDQLTQARISLSHAYLQSHASNISLETRYLIDCD